MTETSYSPTITLNTSFYQVLRVLIKYFLFYGPKPVQNDHFLTRKCLSRAYEKRDISKTTWNFFNLSKKRENEK